MMEQVVRGLQATSCDRPIHHIDEKNEIERTNVMLRFILKRIAIMPAMLLVISFFLYLVINLSPTDPAFGLLPNVYTQEQYDAIYEEYGFDDPIVIQYGRWLADAVRGDMGVSYDTGASVWKEAVVERLPVSAKLAVASVIFVVVLGVPLGVISAVKQYTMVDLVINMGAKTLGSVPAFLYYVILTFIFSINLGWLPSYGLTTPMHWILPIIAGSMPPLGGMIRQTRSSMLDCICQDYITTARSKGIPERTVIFSEALRNALLPVITMTGGQFALLIGGSVVIENCFAIPGLGFYIVYSIQSKNTPSIMGASIVIAIFFMLIMLVVDIAYGVADPRTRASFVSAKRAPKKEVKGVAA